VVSRNLWPLIVNFLILIEGRGEDIVRITENGRRKRFSAFLLGSVALWLLRACERFLASKHSCNWCNHICRGRKILLLKLKRNRSGNFLQLSALLVAGSLSLIVIFPCGWHDSGWCKIFEALNSTVGPAAPPTGGHRTLAPSPHIVAAAPSSSFFLTHNGFAVLNVVYW